MLGARKMAELPTAVGERIGLVPMRPSYDRSLQSKNGVTDPRFKSFDLVENSSHFGPLDDFISAGYYGEGPIDTSMKALQHSVALHGMTNVLNGLFGAYRPTAIRDNIVSMISIWHPSGRP